jgi:hypothetical protein
MAEQENHPLSPEQRTEWVRDQFRNANKHLAENGVLFESVITEESRYLAPYVAIWKIKSVDGKYFWVIAGDLPSDFVLYENAGSAREVIKYFSMSWQMKAERILHMPNADQTQLDFAKLLIERADGLYDIQKDDGLWQAQ